MVRINRQRISPGRSWSCRAGCSPAIKAHRSMLEQLLSAWAMAGAFTQTEEVHDAYYALKRQLLPLTVAYSILMPDLEPGRARLVKDWISNLVGRVDHLFDGDVDRNNHRILADSVLAVWGSVLGDRDMMEKGLSRFDAVIAEARSDGTLELEARRGARALWYQRQTLSSLTVLAEVARGQGIDLYARKASGGQTFAALLGALVNGISSPVLVAVYAAENHIPGLKRITEDGARFPSDPWSRSPLHGLGRGCSAFWEGLSFARLKGLFDRQIRAERPLIDEFVGGNSTCFWGQP